MRGLSLIFEVLPVLSVSGDSSGSGHFQGWFLIFSSERPTLLVERGVYRLFLDNFRFKPEVDRLETKNRHFSALILSIRFDWGVNHLFPTSSGFNRK